MNLNQKELEKYIDLKKFRDDFPEQMQDGDWYLYNELRRKRFEGE